MLYPREVGLRGEREQSPVATHPRSQVPPRITEAQVAGERRVHNVRSCATCVLAKTIYGVVIVGAENQVPEPTKRIRLRDQLDRGAAVRREDHFVFGWVRV